MSSSLTPIHHSNDNHAATPHAAHDETTVEGIVAAGIASREAPSSPHGASTAVLPLASPGPLASPASHLVAASILGTPLPATMTEEAAAAAADDTPPTRKKRKYVKQEPQEELVIKNPNHQGQIHDFISSLGEDQFMVWSWFFEKERQRRTQLRQETYAKQVLQGKKKKAMLEAGVASTTLEEPPQGEPPKKRVPFKKVNRNEYAWEFRFQELLDYRVAHGHVDIPDDLIPQLSKWVQSQRQHYKRKQRGDERTKSSMTLERQRKLQNVGFHFSIKEDFETRFQQLLDFKGLYGHVRVPQHYTEHNKLGTWVKGQRAAYSFLKSGKTSNSSNHCKLTQERIDRLDEIGFEWVVKRRS